MTPGELTKALQAGRLPPLLCLHGEETYLRDRALQEIRAHLIPPEAADFNLTLFDGKECRAAAVLEAACTLPVFSPRRLVIVREVHQVPAAELESLLPYLKDPAPDTVLLLVGEKIDRRRKFFQELFKHGEGVEFKPLRPEQIPDYARKAARQHGKDFTEASLELFCRRIGNELQSLHSEWGKLLTYLGEKSLVETDDVLSVVSDSRTESVFDLTNAVGRGDVRTALERLRQLLEDGVVPLVILAMLTRHFRQLWTARELQQERVPRSEWARRIGVNPYFLDGLVAQCGSLDRPAYRQAFDWFLEADLALKSSGAHPSALLERLILALARAGRVAKIERGPR